MKSVKTITALLLASLALAGLSTAASAWENDVDYATTATATEAPENLYNLPVDYSYSDKYSVSIDGSIVGRIIGGFDPDHTEPYAPVDHYKFWGDANGKTAGWYGAAWDNNTSTMYDPAGQSHNFWTGIMVDEPTVLTSVKVMPRDDRPERLDGGRIQGSNDGVYWYTLASFNSDDIPVLGEFTWVEKSVNTDRAFTMFRYVNIGTNHGNVVDIALYGESAKEPIPEYRLGDINGDNKIDLTDSILLFRHSMLPNIYPINYIGDMDYDNNGSIDIGDAIILFMHSMIPDLYPLG